MDIKRKRKYRKRKKGLSKKSADDLAAFLKKNNAKARVGYDEKSGKPHLVFTIKL